MQWIDVIDLIIAFTHVALKTGTKVKIARQLGSECRVRKEWTDWYVSRPSSLLSYTDATNAGSVDTHSIEF